MKIDVNTSRRYEGRNSRLDKYADLTLVPFYVTHNIHNSEVDANKNVNSKLDVYLCYSKNEEKLSVESLINEINAYVDSRGVELAVDIASAKIDREGDHEIVVTVGERAYKTLDFETIKRALDKEIDERLYEAMYLAKRDYTDPRVA